MFGFLWFFVFFFSSRRRHTRLQGDWNSDVCSSDLTLYPLPRGPWSRRPEFMTVNQLHQVPATRPIKGCSQSFDRIAQSGAFLPCFAGCTPTAHRHDRRFPIHSICIPIIAPSYELRGGGLVGLSPKTSLDNAGTTLRFTDRTHLLIG